VALALERGAPLLTAGTTAQHLGQRLAHRLHDVEMISHDAGPRQAHLDRLAEGATPSHTHRFHAVWLISAL
jgi:hypothetical protein